MFGKIKLRQTDVLFSQYIRKKNNFVCERCKRIFLNGKGLQASHYFGRRHENVRFDEENVSCLCIGCHRFFHENPNEYVQWLKRKLGKKKFDLLEIRAATYKKRDDKLDVIIIKKLLEEYEHKTIKKYEKNKNNF